MKKINTLVLSTLAAALLIGCGGGGGNTATSGSNTTTVPVTKGPLLKATVQDSSNPVKEGTQIEGTNKYSFDGAITYPITVTGGYVDVNNNGVVDSDDYAFTGKLSSYTPVVTPITTYLGDTSKTEGSDKLKALKTLANVTSDDDLLKKDPVETDEKVLALLNTVYEQYNVLMDKDGTNDDIENIQETDVLSKFNSYRTAISQSTEIELSKILIVVEKQLKSNKPVVELDDLEIEKINLSKKSLIGKKLVVNNETYFFRDGDVVLGNTATDKYTLIASYGEIEDGVLKIIFTNGDFDLIEITETGYTVKHYLAAKLNGEPISTTSKLTAYTSEELNTVLTDIQPVFTANMINNKVFYPNNSSDSSNKFEFYSSGLLHVFHTYNAVSGLVNEPWSYLGNTPGNFTIVDGKLRTFVGEETCYQFEMTAVDSEKISVKTTIDMECTDSKSMDAFESTTQYNSLYFTNASLSNLPATKTTTPTSFVSGDKFKGLVYNIITSPVTGKKWLDRNLGATQACTSSTDSACYGDYYQWGRLADGHEKATSTTTSSKSTNITNAGDKFVTVMGDWTTVDSDGSLRSALWSNPDGTGICPIGFRVPTSEEVTAENITSDKVAFDNLKFPVAGARYLVNGVLDGTGVWADVWTSSSSTTAGKSYYINFEGNEVNVDFEYRADGRSVRCIKN